MPDCYLNDLDQENPLVHITQQSEYEIFYSAVEKKCLDTILLLESGRSREYLQQAWTAHGYRSYIKAAENGSLPILMQIEKSLTPEQTETARWEGSRHAASKNHPDVYEHLLHSAAALYDAMFVNFQWTRAFVDKTVLSLRAGTERPLDPENPADCRFGAEMVFWMASTRATDSTEAGIDYLLNIPQVAAAALDEAPWRVNGFNEPFRVLLEAIKRKNVRAMTLLLPWASNHITLPKYDRERYEDMDADAVQLFFDAMCCLSKPTTLDVRNCPDIYRYLELAGMYSRISAGSDIRLITAIRNSMLVNMILPDSFGERDPRFCDDVCNAWKTNFALQSSLLSRMLNVLDEPCPAPSTSGGSNAFFQEASQTSQPSTEAESSVTLPEVLDKSCPTPFVSNFPGTFWQKPDPIMESAPGCCNLQ